MRELIRRSLLLACLLQTLPVWAEDIAIDVYKTPWCGCCTKWVSHLEEQGFKVNAHTVEDMSPVKQRYGITPELASCHTGIVDGYFVEGHVPATDIKKMLAERPDIKGITVPGMPAGDNVPGMETRPGNATYDVLSVSDAGVEVFSQYR